MKFHCLCKCTYILGTNYCIDFKFFNVMMKKINFVPVVGDLSFNDVHAQETQDRPI